jgi:hypothetical protein
MKYVTATGRLEANGWDSASQLLTNTEDSEFSFQIGGDPTYDIALRGQDYPAVAFDGSNFLVVWQDGRALHSSDIYGTRVSVDGTVLDPGGIAIASAPYNATDPAVAFDGVNYLVIWQELYRDSIYKHIYGTRVTVDGIVLDPEGVPITSGNASQYTPAIGFDGTNYLVAWYADGIHGTRVSTDLTVLDPGGIAISIGSGALPAIDFDGTNYLVVWQGLADIYGARVGVDGTVLDPTGILISASGNNEYPSVTYGAGNYLVVWNHNRGIAVDTYAARVSTAGSVLDTSGIAVSVVDSLWEGGRPTFGPAAAFDGTNYMVAWEDNRGDFLPTAYTARLSLGGDVLDPEGVRVSLGELGHTDMAIAFADTNYLVLWRNLPLNPPAPTLADICGNRISTTGNPLHPLGTVISTAANAQFDPAIAFDGTDYLAVWCDYRNFSNDIYGTRVSASGVALDPSGIEIAAFEYTQYRAEVAFDGTNYLVVWEDERAPTYCTYVYGARITKQGLVLDPASIPIGTMGSWNNSAPDLTFDGTNYMVVWHSDDCIYGTRVDVDGVVLDSLGIIISTSDSWCYDPAIAYDGTNYLVVWEDRRSGTSYDIYGARIGTDGIVVDSTAFAICDAAYDQWDADIDFDGTNYLVVWSDARSSTDFDIYGARVDPDGSILDPSGIVIETAIRDQERPAVGYDGDKYYVAWTSRRGGKPYYDVHAARVAIDGTVLDSPPIAVTDNWNDQSNPAICTTSGVEPLIPYCSFSTEPYGNFRIWGVLLDVSGVADDEIDIGPPRLLDSHPNPFGSLTRLRFYLPHRQQASVKVYNVQGQLLKTLLEGTSDAGIHRVEWDGKTEAGAIVSPGIYPCVVETEVYHAATKLVVLR